MAYVIASNIIIDISWYLSLFFTFISVMMIIFILWFRTYSAKDNNRQKTVEDKWEKALFSVVSFKDTPTEVEDLLRTTLDENNENEKYLTSKSISKKEVPHFLYSWNYLQESLRGDAEHRLNQLAEKVSLKDKTLALIKSPLIKHRILALNTLGNLRSKDSFEIVLKFAEKKDPIISVLAFRAMFRIDAEKTRNEYLRFIAEREDWSPAYVAKILNDIGGNALSEKLVELVETNYRNKLNETQMARLVSYLKFADVMDYTPTIEKLLEESDQMEVLIASMRLLRTEDSLPKVRKLLKNDRWQLRMFAVMTLGRFGQKQDIGLLITMLEDLNWWVRYYAARSFLKMPSLTNNNLRKLSSILPNQFQRDILKQVLAEEKFKCLNRTSTILSS